MSLYARQASGSTPVARGSNDDQADAIAAEARVLTTAPGRALLAEVSEVSTPGPAHLARWRKQAPAAVVAAALRLAACRARAKAKFTRGDRMWLDPVGLQQATCETVARHKATRFQDQLVVDLCAGIGGDAVALGERADVLAVDLDHGMCRRIAWNAAVYDVGCRVLPCRSRAETFPIPPEAWIHVDPDRRASGPRRSLNLDGYVPGLEFLHALARRAPGGCIKLGPASDFAAHFSGPAYEIELISDRGECKEATVWFGDAVTCRRRATLLPENVAWTDRQEDLTVRAHISPVSAYVYDPEPALIRSGLLDSFAIEHGLSRIAAEIDYLTSENWLATPWLSAFQTREVLPLDLRRLKQRVHERGLGTLEIKVRGLRLTPEQVRSTLRPRGDQPATLILCGSRTGSVAILAHRVAMAPSPGVQ